MEQLEGTFPGLPLIRAEGLVQSCRAEWFILLTLNLLAYTLILQSIKNW